MRPPLDQFLRQLDVVTPADLDSLGRVTIIGAGGIGSTTALVLAKMGVEQIRIYDHDTVEGHNLPNQMFRQSDLAHNKVAALASILTEFADVVPMAIPSNFTGQEFLSGIVIAAVDSMATRQMIWDHIKTNRDVTCFIDGRIGAETLRVYTIEPSTPGHAEFYEGVLYPDDQAFQAPCTQRATIYTAFAIASFIASQVKKLARREAYSKEILFDFVSLSLVTQ